MSKLSENNRSALIRLASSLPKGDENRREILKRVKSASIFDDQFMEFMGRLPPKIDRKSFSGSAVHRLDKIAMVLESDPTASMTRYGLSIHNPARGGAFFAIKGVEDLDKLKKSFLETLEKVRKAVEDNDAESDAYYEELSARSKARKDQAT